MRAYEAQIEWTPGPDNDWTKSEYPGLILVFKRGGPEHVRSVLRDRLRMSGGACYTDVAKMRGWESIAKLLVDFHTIIARDRVPIEAAHREFLKIDEYRDIIAHDIPGATPEGQTTMLPDDRPVAIGTIE